MGDLFVFRIWPNGNAGASVSFAGDQSTLAADLADHRPTLADIQRFESGIGGDLSGSAGYISRNTPANRTDQSHHFLTGHLADFPGFSGDGVWLKDPVEPLAD
ncbi:MAG: hypothetical protein G01um101419_120 [Parcubacteria group bacterium Gr01-1014_19]|nr:MAG: hypothetical protein G01um101419_120 [Parcubacteria group bacterium Gr01-1014_19]